MNRILSESLKGILNEAIKDAYDEQCPEEVQRKTGIIQGITRVCVEFGVYSEAECHKIVDETVMKLIYQ